MKISNQTCTQEQGARLVELGVKPLATFYHMPAKDGPHGEYIQYGWHSDNLAPAFTVAELGDMMSAGLRYEESSCDIVTGFHSSFVQCEIRTERGKTVGVFGNKTEAQARSSMLILALERGLLQLPEHWKEDLNNPCHGGTCKRTSSADYKIIQPMPMPTNNEVELPAFTQIWKVIKDWTIQAPCYHTGSQIATGCHVKLIIDALPKSQE